MFNLCLLLTTIKKDEIYIVIEQVEFFMSSVNLYMSFYFCLQEYQE